MNNLMQDLVNAVATEVYIKSEHIKSDTQLI